MRADAFSFLEKKGDLDFTGKKLIRIQKKPEEWMNLEPFGKKKKVKKTGPVRALKLFCVKNELPEFVIPKRVKQHDFP